MREDYYVHRWFMHVFDMAGDQIETCTNNMIKALRWRKDENIRGMEGNILAGFSVGQIIVEILMF